MQNSFKKPVLSFLGIVISTGLFAFLLNNNVSVASISSYEASEFSQYCSDNPTICNKVNFQEVDTGQVSCPSTHQVITNVYVHAGDGQTVYELPHTGFDTIYSNNNNTVTVNLTTHPHNISWIGVICGDDQTITNTPTVTPTNTPTPTEIPTPTPTYALSPTPTPRYVCTGNICIICPGGGTCEVTNITPTATPSATLTPTATPTVTATPSASVTPTPTSGGGTGGNNDNGSTDNSSTGTVAGASTGPAVGGQVLGASTLAATGTFTSTASNLGIIAGVLLIASSVSSRLRRNK